VGDAVSGYHLVHYGEVPLVPDLLNETAGTSLDLF
jgi:hypothetical protein